MNRRIDLNDIRLLMQVVEHGSYTAAARAIGVPKSTISQRITHLEATIGTGLLRRTSRSFSLTEAGAQLLPHARAIEELARQVEQSLQEQGGQLHGTLRLSCSQAIAQFALGEVVPRFLAQHQHVTIRVEASNRLVDIIGEGYDMTVRGHVGPLKDSALVQRVVARTPWALVASPAWTAANPVPVVPDELDPGQTLCFTHVPDWQAWTFRKGDALRRVELAPRLISDDMLAVRTSALAGGGIACLPGYLMASALDAGELVEIMPDWRCQSSIISVVTPPKSQSSKLASLFSAFLAAELPALMRFEPAEAVEAEPPLPE